MSFSMWQKLMAARTPTAVSPAARAAPMQRGRTRSRPGSEVQTMPIGPHLTPRRTSLGLGEAGKKKRGALAVHRADVRELP